MQIDIKEITSENSTLEGSIVWICDFRQPDLNKKPIRHVTPQPVLVRSNKELPKNKRIYYSNNHFVKLKANGEPTTTVIPVFDNTGYRAFSGTPLNVFDNQQECIDFYNNQADIIVTAIEEYLISITESLQREKRTILANKF